jgi:hypothetical protein
MAQFPMNTVAELKSQAELPQWLHPLADQIASQVREELQANTKELAEVRSQLNDLIEVQIAFLEQLQRTQSGQ